MSFCSRTPLEACLEVSVEIVKGAERSGSCRTGWEVKVLFNAWKVSLQDWFQDQG